MTIQRKTRLEEATIAAAGTESDAIPIEGMAIGSIITDAQFVTADVTFLVSDAKDGTFVPFNKDGSAVTVSGAVASSSEAIPADVVATAWYLKFKTSAAQTNGTVIKVLLKG